MPALGVFLACATQWRMGPMGGVLGLDYHGVEVVLRLKRIKDKNALFDDLRVMERAALSVLNSK